MGYNYRAHSDEGRIGPMVFGNLGSKTEQEKRDLVRLDLNPPWRRSWSFEGFVPLFPWIYTVIWSPASLPVAALVRKGCALLCT